MTASCPARAEEAKLTPMTNNPGILPFKLGPSKIKQSDHIFVHYVDLDSIKENIEMVKNQIMTLEALVHDFGHDYRFRFASFHEYISDRYSSILDKYNSLSRNRLRRALIDGLGTLIHSITGNLDQNDAARYDKAISALQKNQNEIAHHTNKAITLNNLFMENYNETISSLVKNQDKLNSKISEIIRNTNISQQEFIDFVKLDSSYKLLEINIQTIFNTLSDLESAISLSTKHIAHHNLITFSNLEYFLTILRKHYSSDQLITSDVKETRLFYRFLEISSYFSDNKLVFIIKVPIFYKDMFSYYYLFPIPTSNNTILIPEKSYLVMNENAYQYLETPCDRVADTYYCQENTLLQESERNPNCVYKLIISQKLSPLCQYHRIQVDQDIFEKINDEYYILISPNSTKFHIQCIHDEYLKTKGAYLLSLPENCSASTEKVTFTNIHTTFNGVPIKLFAFNLEETVVKNPLQPLKMENVNLKNLHSTIGYIEREQQPVILGNPDIRQHLLYWTTPLYVVFILIVSYVIYLKRCKKTGETITTIESAGAEAEPVQTGSHPRSFFKIS